MANENLLQQINAKARQWIQSTTIDQETRNHIQRMMKSEEKELIESFYKDLEFGTGGLRGIMGAGTNRVNIYTIGMATQGLSNYLKQQFADKQKIKVAIAHDSRNNSRLFAEKTASVFSANGIKVYLFEQLRPTPELSFAIRHLGCQSGVVITASHNPKEYNGYKVYWEDGGQIIRPHDKNIIAEVQKITSIDEIRFDPELTHVESIGENIDREYIKQLTQLSLHPEVIRKQKDLKIVYTPIHGTGVELVPRALRAFGFENIHSVEEQNLVDGNFSTVQSPNPEEPAAMELALQKAASIDADLVMATDPDSDRVGIAVKDLQGKFVLLNGNQAAALLIHYLITQWKAKGKLKGREYIVKTIVTSDILTEMAEKYGIQYYEVLTGFKYIADIIKQNERKKIFIGGGEESYGYLAGEFVRDKDAVMSCALLAETAAWAKNNGKTLYEQLIDIYVEFGFYKEKLISTVKKGKDGEEQIKKMMDNFRNNPPQTVNHSNVMLIHDFLKQKTFDQLSHLRYEITLPPSNVLQFILKDGSKISIRPSGTEPKIKFYFSVNERLESKEDFERVNKLLEDKIDQIVRGLGIDY
ncbi:MAG: phospho-sugar mutase [Bacteroidales bacterium]|jgi:phosphoglucomutase|nr:phospho-sugar mutase [Bacteroidales bacterium]